MTKPDDKPKVILRKSQSITHDLTTLLDKMPDSESAKLLSEMAKRYAKRAKSGLDVP